MFSWFMGISLHARRQETAKPTGKTPATPVEQPVQPPEPTSDVERLVRDLTETLQASGGRPDVYTGKRGTCRQAGKAPIELDVGGVYRPADCLNVSDAGVLVRYRQPIPGIEVGMEARLRPSGVDTPWVAARIAHVTPSLAGTKLGLEFVED